MSRAARSAVRGYPIRPLRSTVQSMQLTPLAPRARWLFHLQGLVRLVVVGPPLVLGAVIGLSFVVPWLWALGIAFGLGLVASLAAVWVPSLAFAAWGYHLSEQELLVQHGVLLRRLVAIPTARVQHVDTYQGPLDRLFGLARLHVYTASGTGADGVIPGLELTEATRLRDRLVAVGEDDVV